MITILPKVPRPLVHRNKFAIECNGFDLALFTKCKLPEVEFDEIAFSAAGSEFDQKVAGRAKYADITMEKGVLQLGLADTGALDWIQTILEVNTGLGVPAAAYVRDVDIVLYGDLGLETRRFTLHGAWPKKIEYGDADGSVSENVIEIITLAYQYFTVG
jgi:phage tail-like protein